MICCLFLTLHLTLFACRKYVTYSCFFFLDSSFLILQDEVVMLPESMGCVTFQFDLYLRKAKKTFPLCGIDCASSIGSLMLLDMIDMEIRSALLHHSTKIKKKEIARPVEKC